MQNINTATITGNLTKDPELRHTGGGTPVCNLRVAVNGSRKADNGEWVDTVHYIDVTVWGARGKACADCLKKGSAVAVNGRLDWNGWESQDGGGWRERVRIVAFLVEFIGPKRSGSGDGQGIESTAPSPQAQEATAAGAANQGEFAGGIGGVEDDIPF